MNIQIPYNELSGFVRDRFNQNLVMNFVDEKTISIGKEIRVAMLSKLVSVNLTVKQVSGNDVTLVYNGGMGLDLLVKATLKYFKEKMGGLVEELDGNTLVVHLQKIEQLKDALKTVALGGLSFDKTNANVQVQMR
ncbi:MAG: hypothetical protein IKD78_13750 [Bacteroidales bacterium]|nr:hypothetical protein [Bacteroidales bacterium]